MTNKYQPKGQEEVSLGKIIISVALITAVAAVSALAPEYPSALVAGIKDKINVFAATDTIHIINNQINEAKRTIKLQQRLTTLTQGLDTLEEEEIARRKKLENLLDLTIAKVKGNLSIAGNIVPAEDSTYDLGADGTEWKNIYIDNIDFGTNSIGNGKFIGGNWTFDGKELSGIGKLTVEDIVLDDSTISANNDDGLYLYDNDSNGIQIADGGKVTFTDDIAVSGKIASNLLPSADDTYDLGSSTFKWQDIYIDGTAYIDTLSVSGSTSNTGGGTFGNIQIGVTGANEIDTSSGNLTLDSLGGAVTIDDALTVSGATTLSSTLAVTGASTFTGAITANGQFTLGDNTDTGAIDTSDWDISTTGDLTGIGGITMDGNLTVADDSWIGIGAASERIVFDSTNDISFPTGNIGIGTTSPTALVEIVGQCVTGDTKLRRRRRRRRKNLELGTWDLEELRKKAKELGIKGADKMSRKELIQALSSKLQAHEPSEYYWEEVRIDEINPGDEIQTLDETTGEFVVSRVNNLMDMGIKQTFRLVTEDGRAIRTTAQHPYLVKDHGWLKVSQLSPGMKIAVAPTSYTIPSGYKPKLGIFVDDSNMFYAQRKAGWRIDYQKLENLLSKNFNVQFINYHVSVPSQSDRAYAKTQRFLEKLPNNLTLKKKLLKYIEDKNEKLVKKGDIDVELSLDVIENLNELDTVIVVSGDSDYAALRDYVLNKGKQFAFLGFEDNFAWELRNGKHLILDDYRASLALGEKTTPKPKPGVALLRLLYANETNLSRKQLEWAKIDSIDKHSREQVYDIEVEGTHNFVGNGIVAHNTYISGGSAALGIGYDPSTISGGVLAINGNVGIGTTAPSARLSVGASSQFQVSSTGTVTTTGTITSTASGYNVQIYAPSPTTVFDNHLHLISTETTGAADTGGAIRFSGHNGSSAEMGWAYIRGMKENSTVGNNSTYLAFATRLHGGIPTERLRINSSGNVGIGTTGPTDELHVEGQIFTTTGLHIGADSTNNLFDDASNGTGSTTMYIGNASINVTASDIRLKENILPSSIDALDILNSLPVRDFDWKPGTKWAGRGRATGLVAQEIYNILPQVVDKPDDPANIWSVEYQHLVPYTIKAIQELSAKLNEQTSSPPPSPDPVDLTFITDHLSFLDNQIASISAELAEIKTASPSAQLPLGETKTATVSGELTVLGTTILADLSVTGRLTNGLLDINGLDGSIQTIAEPLKLQKDALGDLEIMAGKVVIDQQGNLKIAGDVEIGGDLKVKGSARFGSGITLVDEETGEEYCLGLKAGQLTTTPGACEETPTPTPTPTTIP